MYMYVMCSFALSLCVHVSMSISLTKQGYSMIPELSCTVHVNSLTSVKTFRTGPGSITSCS